MACIVYPEADPKTPLDFCKEKLINKPTRYYMQVQKACNSQHVVINNMTLVPFNWENVLQLGTKKQQEIFNIFRNEYIHELVIKYCENHACNPVPVGSAATSASSDIDFNMYSQKKDVDYVIMQINKHHEKKFKDPIEELFDVNIYGTVVDVIDGLICNASKCVSLPKHASEEQHVWAFLRFAELLHEYTSSFKLSDQHMHLYKKSLALSKKLFGKKNQHSMYLRNIRKYIRYSEKEQDTSKLATVYSRTKYYERETYRSVGAILHIVIKKQNLPENMFIDSVYDNLGFAAEVLLTPTICPRYRKDTRVYKTCKYISRISDALLSIKKLDIENLKDIKNHCEKMNDRRKQMLPLLDSDYRKLCKLIHAPVKFKSERFLQAIYDCFVYKLG